MAAVLECRRVLRADRARSIWLEPPPTQPPSRWSAGFTMMQIIGIVFCGTLISVMSLFFANHLITNPSAKTRKKIEKLEQLEAVEIGGGGGSRRVGGGTRRAQSGGTKAGRTTASTSTVATTTAQQGSTTGPRKFWSTTILCSSRNT